MNNKQLGKQGEEIACNFLTARGYEIIEKNFWSQYGEIDLIGQDKETLVFIEVKLARVKTSISPKEQITYRKKQHLQRAASYYLLTQASEIDSNCRFDIVAISGLKKDNRQIELIRNAFLVN